ncbi:hypothetical protein Tco_0738035 [Tanacetum coccineum]
MGTGTTPSNGYWSQVIYKVMLDEYGGCSERRARSSKMVMSRGRVLFLEESLHRCRRVAIRNIHCQCSNQDMIIYQDGVKTDFLNGVLQEESSYADADHADVGFERSTWKCSVSWRIVAKRTTASVQYDSSGTWKSDCFISGRLRDMATVNQKKWDDFIIPALGHISSDHLKMEMEMEIPSSSNVKLMSDAQYRLHLL